MDPQQSLGCTHRSPCYRIQALIHLEASAIPETSEANGFVEGHFFASTAHGVKVLYFHL